MDPHGGRIVTGDSASSFPSVHFKTLVIKEGKIIASARHARRVLTR